MKRAFDYVLDAPVLEQPGLRRTLVRQKREVVAWVTDRKPDSDTTVHIFAPSLSEPVWLGYWCDGTAQWYSVEGTPLGDAVLSWAEMLKGRA